MKPGGGATASGARREGTEPVRFAAGACSLGAVLVVRGARGLREAHLGDDPAALVAELRARHPDAAPDDAAAPLLEALVARIEAPGAGPEPPLDPVGTPFQRRVWAALRGIPLGATASYAELAAWIAAPGAARAVGRACAANRLAVLVPCHRAVRGDGGLAGYRWGIERKRALLERERRAAEGRAAPPAGA